MKIEPNGLISTKNCTQEDAQSLAWTTKKNWAYMQSCNTMLFVQYCFNQSYLPRFNSDLRYVWSIGFLTSRASKLYVILPNKLTRSGNDFCSNLTSLCCHALYATLLHFAIYPSVQRRIALLLNHWIRDFLRFKSICGLPKENIGR